MENPFWMQYSAVNSVTRFSSILFWCLMSDPCAPQETSLFLEFHFGCSRTDRTILGRSWCTGSQGQRGFQLHEGKQKPSLCQPPGREGQPCCPLHHGISCQGKHTTVQLWGKQHFHSERKRMGAKSAPVAWVGPRSCQGQQVPRQRCRGTGPCSPSSQRTLTPFLWSLKFWGWRHSAQA